MAPLARRHRRWAVPVAALGTFLAIGALPSLSPAGADVPTLPTLTPAELLAKARTAQPGGLSGTVVLHADLGLPAVSALAGPLGGSSTTSLSMLLGGTHAASVWMDGPEHLRVATAKPLAETNWVRNGADLWSYDSATKRATHATFPAAAESQQPTEKAAEAPDPAETPAAFAQSILDEVTPSTDVRVDTPRYLDGRPVYELVLSPKAATSTVRDAVVSVDAATGLPLAVRIDARSGSNPALQFGFSSVQFETPAASTFTFSPPPGATVMQAASPTDVLAPMTGHRHHGERTTGAKGDPKDSPDTSPANQVDSPKAPRTTTLGEGWTAVEVIAAGAVPAQASQVFASAPRVVVGQQHGRLLTTKLLSALLLDDGRAVVGAVSPAALEAAAAGS